MTTEEEDNNNGKKLFSLSLQLTQMCKMLNVTLTRARQIASFGVTAVLKRKNDTHKSSRQYSKHAAHTNSKFSSGNDSKVVFVAYHQITLTFLKNSTQRNDKREREKLGPFCGHFFTTTKKAAITKKHFEIGSKKSKKPS